MNKRLSQMRSFWRNVTQRHRVESDLHAELDSYLQMLVDEKVRAGITERDARRLAQLELGGTEQVKEHVRDAKSGLWLDAFWQDLRFAFRGLRKTPLLTAVALFSLAVGIGVNASLFSLVDRLVLTTLPGSEASRPSSCFPTIAPG